MTHVKTRGGGTVCDVEACAWPPAVPLVPLDALLALDALFVLAMTCRTLCRISVATDTKACSPSLLSHTATKRGGGACTLERLTC